MQANNRALANPMPTPSNHRTQLGPLPQSSSRLNSASHRTLTGVATRNLHEIKSSQRQPFSSGNGTRSMGGDRPGMSGYGLSAGMKVGRGQYLPKILC